MAAFHLSPGLQVVSDLFWQTNPELKNKIFRDLYVHGRILTDTQAMGSTTVDAFLKTVNLEADTQP